MFAYSFFSVDVIDAEWSYDGKSHELLQNVQVGFLVVFSFRWFLFYCVAKTYRSFSIWLPKDWFWLTVKLDFYCRNPAEAYNLT